MKKNLNASLIILIILLIFSAKSYAQTAASVQKNIELANKKFIGWFNSGKADSIVTQYHTNACIANGSCGKPAILNHYRAEADNYKLLELITLSVTVKDNLATETGQWKIQLPNGNELTGRYKTEWQQINNQWLILKESVLE